MSLGKAVYNILNSDSDVNTAASGGIFPGIARQGAVPPYIVYRIDETEPNDTKDGVSDFDFFFIIIEAYAKTYSAVDDLSIKVRTALDRYSGTANGVTVTSVQFEDKVDVFTGDARFHSQEEDFKVWITN